MQPELIEINRGHGENDGIDKMPTKDIPLMIVEGKKREKRTPLV